MDTSRNIAARAGRWSATHRKTAIWGWLAFVILAVFIGGSVGTRTLTDAEDGVGESGRAEVATSNNFPENATERVLITAPAGGSNTSAAMREAAADLSRELRATPYVSHVESPFAPGNRGQISADGKSALVSFELAGNEDQLSERLGATQEAVNEARARAPGYGFAQFGDASASEQIGQAFEDDFKKAEFTSLPVTLLILVFAFGAFIAAGVPLLLGLTSVAAAIGLTALVSHVTPMSDAANSVILLIGLAVGVDYSLFYLRREREERAAGRSESAALEAAAATSGRAVIVSGITVMIAMAGMYMTGDATFASFATGTIIVVAVAVLGSLTVLPAVLAWLGDRVDKGRIPLIDRLRRSRKIRRVGGEESVLAAGNGGGFWGRFIRTVLRRPGLSAVAAAGLLVLLAVPAFKLHTVVPGAEALPQDLPVIKAYNQMDEAFPGGPEPANVVIEADDVRAPEVQQGIAALRQAVDGPAEFGSPVTTTVSPNGKVEVVNVPLAGSGTDDTSNDALVKLREEVIPETIGKVPGTETNVNGMTAGSKDFNDLMKSRAPLVFAFVLLTAFILLMVAFRSIVIPATSILLNLLSVGAAYGLLVWVFQEGHLEGLLGFESMGGITAWLPMFLFVVLFGLSMDYHVFILSRIREAHDQGLSTSDAIEAGLRRTAGPVTSAAIVMVAVFSIFATLSMLEFKQMGVGLAAAVLIDATIVRGVLVPASMKLLGKWNWYLPAWLEWLPKLNLEGTPEPAPRPAV
ncbi:MAG TPA: MMPL family transporter [Solirubrobacterales bacterium]|jgi:RND superfamily putative drug exporter|nr:MMPL family transporter [Solirubrobacterales bacterium]HMU26646.1 MMPL family transporter [Solirubrobacterales bacterium]HMX70123.1 MMPL family transporter [Solirubrobacterales bacterium]HMY26756.1 MMPL family transporter [Solirubrobacterales bacterium]HNA23338.1 MMPL family transporter [Solirubrobacterales bacterium]